MHSQQTIDILTVSSSTNTGMDLLYRNISDNYNEVRGRTSSPKPQSSKASSMSSTKSSVAYYKRIENNNGLDEDFNMEDDSPQLSYVTLKEQANHVSTVANPNTNTTNKYVLIEYSISNPPRVDNTIINIQLLYDPNAPTKPKLWNGSFHPISLYGSIKYLASDYKNIKNSLNFMAKDISNKQINPAKSNNLEDFKGIGEAIWNLISSIYQSKWNSFIANKNSNTLRQKISVKFTLRVLPVSNKNNKSIGKLVLASIEKIPLPIPAKSQKEVNQISRYFKNIKPVTVTKLTQKSYMQASKQSMSIFEVIKIKDAFLALGAKKIDQI